MMSADEVIALLGLEPLPGEGGYFRETWRSGRGLDESCLGPGYEGARSMSTAIYYLLRAGECSRMHRLLSDEVFHFYAGGAVTMLLLHPDGASEVVTLGAGLERGERPQVAVPARTWMGAMLAGGEEWALLGTTVSPGFEFADYEQGDCAELVRQYPEQQELIRLLG